MNRIKLNQIQYKFWMDSLIKYPSVEYNIINFTFIIDKCVSLDILKEAYRCILLEYPPYSSIVEIDEETPYFVFDVNKCDVPFTILEADNNDIDELISRCVHVPFDLQKQYPCHFYAIHKDDCYYLVNAFHHLVIDGFSFPLFVKRLSDIYNSLLTNTYHPILQEEELRLFNATFDNDYMEHKEENLKYWKDFIQDYPLKVSYPRITNQKLHPSAINIKIGNDTYKEVLKFKSKRYTSLFRMYASVWALTIAKAMGVERILVDHSINMRPKGNTSLFGVFVNNLPLRFDFSESDLTMANIFSLINDNMEEEKNHRHSFYHQIFHELGSNTKQVPGGINVSFSYKTGYTHLDLKLEGCNVRPYKHVDVEFSNGLLLLIEDDDQISCTLRYNDQISESYAKTLLELFKTILKQVLANPSIKLSDIQLLSEDDQKLLLQKENERLRQAVVPQTFESRFKRIVSQNQDRFAVIFGTHKLTYKDLDEMSSHVAAFLQQHGYYHCRIGLSSPKNEKIIAAILGILKSGNTYVPIDFKLPRERVDFMIMDCQLSAVLGTSEVCSLMVPYVKTYSFDEIFVKPHSICKSVEILPTDEAYIIYTSGTTGKPKSIPIQHSMLNQTILNTEDYLDLSPNSRVSQFANICFDASLIEIFPVLNYGGTLVIPNDEEGKDPILFHQFLKKNRITFSYIPPVFLSNIPDKSLPDLETIIVAGDSTSQSTIQKWCQDYCLINAYGPTESTVGATLAILTPESMSNDIGTPEKGVTCYVLDKDYHLLPNNMIGELFIGGVKLTDGYLNRPDLNMDKFIKNPFVSPEDKVIGRNLFIYKTGDLVIRRDDGHLLFMGRSDFQVKLNGYRIELGDIQAQIFEYDKSINEVVVSLHEFDNHKQLVAYLQVDDVEHFSQSALRNFLQNKLPNYMVPSIIIPLHKFPCNASGKIDRKQLPDPALFYREERQIIEPETSTEKKLAELWETLVPGQTFGRNDNFIALGGDSLTVIHMSLSIEKLFGVNVRVTDIYRYSTLSSLAHFIDEEADTVVSNETTLLSSEQFNIWLHCVQSDQLNIAYNLPFLVECPLNIQKEKIQEAINLLIEHNESLRMTIPLNYDRKPLVHILPYEWIPISCLPTTSDLFYDKCRTYVKKAFDLEEGPLYRIQLYNVDNNKYFFLIVLHRLIADTYSAELIKSLILRYISGEKVDWSIVSGSYSDYANKCAEFRHSSEYKARLNFWENNLNGISSFQLPCLSTRQISDTNSSLYSQKLTDSLSRKVDEFCSSNDCHPSMIFYSIYLLLFCQLSGKKDFAIGIPCSGRERGQDDTVIGNYMNVLPLSFRHDYESKTFIEYVMILNQDYNEEYKNLISWSDLARIVSSKKKDQSLSRVRAICYYGQHNLETHFALVNNIPFGLIFEVRKEKGSFMSYLLYQHSFFSDDCIELISRAYMKLLDEALSNPQKLLNDFAIGQDEQMRGSCQLFNSALPEESDKKVTIVEHKSDLDGKPRTIAETLALDIVSSILHEPNIGINDNLFDYGINSLQVFDAVVKLEEVGVRSSVSDFYKNKTIKKILADKESLLCYWQSEYDSSKPLLLVVSGYPYYIPYYNDFNEVFKDHYSLLVLESYHESFINKEEYKLDELLDSYVKILKPILKDKLLSGITGLCIGGEIAVQLAYLLDKQNIARPSIFVIEGYANRDEVENHIFVEFQFLSDDLNKEFNRITQEFLKTFHFNVYEGETHICLANHFSARSVVSLSEDESVEMAYNEVYKAFETNASAWKRKMPHCQIHMIEADHYSVIYKEQSLKLKKIIDDSLLNK